MVGGTGDHQGVDKELPWRPWAAPSRQGGSRHTVNSFSFARALCSGEMADRQLHVLDCHRIRDQHYSWCWPVGLMRRGTNVGASALWVQLWLWERRPRTGEEWKAQSEACTWQACLLKTIISLSVPTASFTL